MLELRFSLVPHEPGNLKLETNQCWSKSIYKIGKISFQSFKFQFNHGTT